jgi:imidazole glycerol-phosphate synthase subunit HisH
MIAIIDYGMGNLRSVQKGFEKVGFEAIVTDDPKKLLEAERIVLPWRRGGLWSQSSG